MALSSEARDSEDPPIMILQWDYLRVQKPAQVVHMSQM